MRGAIWLGFSGFGTRGSTQGKGGVEMVRLESWPGLGQKCAIPKLRCSVLIYCKLRRLTDRARHRPSAAEAFVYAELNSANAVEHNFSVCSPG